jgi:hypothetical protein
MTLSWKIPAAVLPIALACFASSAAADPMTVAPPASASAAQQVDWRGGPKGQWVPDQSYGYGGPWYGYGYGADYAYSPGLYGYTYAPGAYGYGYGYSWPGYPDYGYAPGYPDYGYAPGYPDYGYVAPGAVAPAPGRDEGYCAQRYRSYDPASGTYLGYDGVRHSCP